MPPGPAFGWLCVLHSVTDIAVRAAQIRASQVLPTTRHVVSPEFHLPKSNAEEGRLKAQFAGDAQSTHDAQTLHTNDASTDPPSSISLSYLNEQQATPTLLPSRSVEQVSSEQSFIDALSPIFAGHVLEPPLPDDLKLPATHSPLSLESSFGNVSSLEIPLNPAPISSATEASGHEIDNSAPVDYEVCF
ncbi:hypothetical protein K503DRAFT_522621 [Rhizopogon vinicolor AM-OR11-026]|uniref:Uncharacterized protein n=1 Tax=Rhizopogon vinicolor AM-OR11-026 TaxID=1314800 RepID=A0A1B7MLJ4_9AGAM|nr:hypothetical protein K503DRAFT_522621 [Rhizopogon vinicolor AM-OR11-026]